MLAIIFVYLIGGCFIDILPLMLLTLPIFFPIVTGMGYDPIWFCIVIVLASQAGVITPPVGVNVFVVHGLARDIPVGTIFRGSAPFLLAIIVMIGIVFVFPQLVTFLPSLATY
jgi:TRAP-type C4-dicarboxylate transport system permease large subunit